MSGNIRSCVLAKNSLNIFILSNNSDEDTTTVVLETFDGIVLIVPGYMAQDHRVKAAITLTPIVICADANAHYTTWGSTDTNIRAELLFSFINNNLVGAANLRLSWQIEVRLLILR